MISYLSVFSEKNTVGIHHVLTPIQVANPRGRGARDPSRVGAVIVWYTPWGRCPPPVNSRSATGEDTHRLGTWGYIAAVTFFLLYILCETVLMKLVFMCVVTSL